MGRPLEVGRVTGQRLQRMVNDDVIDLGSAWSSHKTNEILRMANRLHGGKDLGARFADEIETFGGNVWAWVQSRIRAGDYQGINVGDWIRFEAGGNAVVAEVAGIDTYRRGMSPEVGNHIDFISRDLWPEPVVWNLANYNNGTAAMPQPFLASNVHAFINSLRMDVPNGTAANPPMANVDYRDGGILSRLPAELRDVLVPKVALMERRFSAGLLLVDSNSWDWREMGLLWLPAEAEIYGHSLYGTHGYSASGHVQYPLFVSQKTKRIKRGANGREAYWLATVMKDDTLRATVARAEGYARFAMTGINFFSVPVCFRIA